MRFEVCFPSVDGDFRLTLSPMIFRNILCSGIVPLLLAIGANTASACSLEQSVYRDVAKRGFTLEFFPKSRDSLVPLARAELRHAQRGRIFKFEVTQSNGYGTYFLNRIDTDQPSHITIYFFDNDLIAADPSVATWAFAADLGAADYYATREKPSVGDAMWKFERCKK